MLVNCKSIVNVLRRVSSLWSPWFTYRCHGINFAQRLAHPL